jgi:hypothetical protein
MFSVHTLARSPYGVLLASAHRLARRAERHHRDDRAEDLVLRDVLDGCTLVTTVGG